MANRTINFKVHKLQSPPCDLERSEEKCRVFMPPKNKSELSAAMLRFSFVYPKERMESMSLVLEACALCKLNCFF